MQEVLSPGQGLLVNGPASVKVLDGFIDALGVEVRPQAALLVRAGKAIPIMARMPSTVGLILGEGASREVLDHDPFPDIWGSTLQDLQLTPPSSVAVLGGTDSGKTTFCIMLANSALRAGLRVALIDGDIGQAELGTPTTVSMRLLTRQTVDLFPLTPDRSYFVGLTTPSALPGRLVDSLVKLNDYAITKQADIIIINTDGWVEGSEAVEYKAEMITRLHPVLCIVLRISDESEALIEALYKVGSKTIVLPTPTSIRKRSREERRNIRQLGYRKDLKELVCRTMRLDQVQLMEEQIGNEARLGQVRTEQPLALGERVLYGEEKDEGGTIMVDKPEQAMDEPMPTTLKPPPTARNMLSGSERGLIVGLLGKQDELLALGIIKEINYEKEVIQVLTRFKARVDSIQIGRVRLDRECREIAP